MLDAYKSLQGRQGVAVQSRPSRAARKRQRERAKLQEAGVSTLVLGIVFVLAPAFVGNPTLHATLKGLRGLGWMLILAGIVLLVLYRATRERSAAFGPPPGAPLPGWGPAPAPSLRRPLTREETTLGPIVADAPGPAAAERNEANAGPDKPSKWSSAVFDVIEWRRFEAVCESLFGQAGFETKSQSHGADGGVDIWLYSKHHPEGPVKVVQCKHWKSKQVGVAEVRMLLGTMTDKKVQRGIFATTSTFTDDAKSFAQGNGIQLLDRRGLLELIAQRTPEQQQELLAAATKGEFWVPTCASCGVKMKRRARKSDGTAFWGCVNYPRCKTRLNV